MVDGGPDSNWVLEGVVVVVLGDGLEVVFILLIDEGDGYSFGGSKCLWVFVDSVSGAECNITDGDDLCFPCALCL